MKERERKTKANLKGNERERKENKSKFERQ
jgi:hypothetical protein